MPLSMENIELIIGGVFLAFVVYALLLLTPVYRFLKREEKTAQKHWTGENLKPPSTTQTDPQKTTADSES